MKKILSISSMAIGIATCATPSFAEGTLQIQNKWTGDGAPQMYLWMEYKALNSSNVMLNGAAVQAEQYIKMADTNATLTWDTISKADGSHAVYIRTDNKAVSFNLVSPPISPPK